MTWDVREALASSPRKAVHLLDLLEGTHGPTLAAISHLPQEPRQRDQEPSRRLQLERHGMQIISRPVALEHLQHHRDQQRMMAPKRGERHTRHGRGCEAQRDRNHHHNPLRKDIHHRQAMMTGESPNHHQRLGPRLFRREAVMHLQILVAMNLQLPIRQHISHTVIEPQLQNSSHIQRHRRDPSQMWIL